MTQHIELDPGLTRLRIGKHSHPIEFGKRFRPTEEFTIATYKFLDEKGIESDGCTFAIHPGGSTQVMRIVREDFTCHEMAIAGRGTFLGVDSDGNLTELFVDANDRNSLSPLVEQTVGCIGCWIADPIQPDGGCFLVIDVSTPPFDNAVEQRIETGDLTVASDPEIAEAFWNRYMVLKKGVKK